MSEMLANRYFFARRFADAVDGFEAVLRKKPDHVLVRKKLLVCYVYTGRLPEAIQLAVGLMQKDAEALMQTDLEAEGFPCQSMVDGFRKKQEIVDEGTYHTGLALLLLLCNSPEVTEHLRLAAELDPVCSEIRTLRTLVLKHLEAKNA